MARVAMENNTQQQTSSGGGVRRPAGLRVPSAEELAPVWTEALSASAPHPVMWMLGAHGGAGASTLAQTWAPAGDARGGWPAKDQYPHVVVVARTHRVGLTAAHTLLRQAAADLAPGCTVLGLVTIADQPGRLPTTLSRQLDTVEGLAPAVWRLPFLDAYRTLTVEQMPVWSPLDPIREVKRSDRAKAAEMVHPDLARVGLELFGAARTAAGR